MSPITQDVHQKKYGEERKLSGGKTTPVKQWVGNSNTTVKLQTEARVTIFEIRNSAF